MEKLSIVIPTWQEAPRIAAAVAAAWEIGPTDVIVVDGGSPDGTAELAKAAGAETLVSPPGRAVQQNRGAAVARGDVLLFLHADNRLDPTGGRQIAAALAEPACVGGAFLQRIDDPRRIYRWLEQGNAFRVCRWGLAYGDQGIFVRRAVFEALGGFPEVRLLEDILFMRRLRSAGLLRLLPGPLTVDPRRWHRHGVVRQTLRNWCILAAHRLGVSTERLATWYRPQAGRS